MPDDTLYFAYGSNLDPAQMIARCPGSAPLEPAWLDGYQLRFSGVSRRWGGAPATIVANGDTTVPGLLYRMTPKDVDLLDGFEGFPTVYTRLHVPVRDAKGNTREVITYQRVKDAPPAPPSMLYFHQIWRGYKALGLEEDALLHAVEEGLNGKS